MVKASWNWSFYNGDHPSALVNNTTVDFYGCRDDGIPDPCVPGVDLSGTADLTAPEVHWDDGEHQTATQNGNVVSFIDPMDVNAAQKLNRRMRQSDHNYEHKSTSGAAINSCREVRFQFNAADYTNIDGSFGFAGCSVTLNWFGSERPRINYFTPATGSLLVGSEDGAAEPPATLTTRTWDIPTVGGFLLVSEDPHALTLFGMNASTSARDGFFYLGTVNSGSGSGKNISVDCTDGELIALAAAGGGGAGFGYSGKGKSWNRHISGNVAQSDYLHSYGQWNIDYRNLDLWDSHGPQDFRCVWTPNYKGGLTFGESGGAAVVTLTGSYWCDSYYPLYGDGVVTVTAGLGGSGKNKDRGSVHIVADDSHLDDWFDLTTGNIHAQVVD